MACSLSADRDMICHTKSIPTLTLRQLLLRGRHQLNEIENNEQDQLLPHTLTHSHTHCESTRWLVPVFQRRYCWGISQVKKLVADCVSITTLHTHAHTDTHSLGRIVVHTQSTDRVLLIDGQQRLTTCTLFLSAIRDFLQLIINTNQESKSIKSLQILVKNCHHLIYSTTCQHTVLEPSYYDRKSYSACVKSSSSHHAMEEFHSICEVTDETCDEEKSVNGTSEVNYVLQTRAYLDKVLASGSLCDCVARKLRKRSVTSLGANCHEEDLGILTSVCQSIIQSLTDAFTFLYFETHEQDICSVYERLAMREAMLMKGFSNAAPGVTLAEADLARNLITSFGCDSASQISLYQQYWAPLEQKAMATEKAEIAATSTKSTKQSSLIVKSGLPSHTKHKAAMKIGVTGAMNASASNGMTSHLQNCLQAFMDSRAVDTPNPHRSIRGSSSSQSPYAAWKDPGESLFPMYAGLKTCIRDALQTHDLPITMQTPSPEAEAVVTQLFTDILKFALEDYDWSPASKIAL